MDILIKKNIKEEIEMNARKKISYVLMTIFFIAGMVCLEAQTALAQLEQGTARKTTLIR